MEINEEQLDAQIVKINLSGRLDHQGVDAVSTRFAGMTASPRTAVIVDMAAVSFLSSLGIRMILMSAKAISKRGGKMILVKPDGNARAVLASSGIDQLISVLDSLDEACAQLGTNNS